MLRAADVEQRVAGLVRAHVVDRGEVEEVVDLALELVADAQPRLVEVADDGLDAIAGVPAFDQLVELLARALAHEHVDVALALEQSLHEVTPDEARGARDEIRRQRSLLP